jgi:purine-cytosine permease-like protein
MEHGEMTPSPARPETYYYGAIALTMFFTLLGVAVALLYPAQEKIAAACMDMSKVGAGAVFGLVAGKVIGGSA